LGLSSAPADSGDQAAGVLSAGRSPSVTQGGLADGN
jgi:hypothetical protein